VLPTAAILRGPQGAFVYLVKPDKTVEARSVTIALSQGTTTAVLAGLNPGDTVVTDGQDKLQTGSSIEPRSAGPSNTAGGSSPASGTAASGIPAS
jgi:multidrug efflux system membrane fusion protein